MSLDLIFFFYQSCRYLASYMNTHRSKRECVVIMFHIIYCRLCLHHQLIQYLVIQLFRFYNEKSSWSNGLLPMQC